LILTIDFSDRADVARHDRMALLVERMLSLHKQLSEAGTPWLHAEADTREENPLEVMEG